MPRTVAPSSLTARLGGWLPVDKPALDDWLATTIRDAESARRTMHPVVEEFRALIENDPVLTMYFTQMFQEQPDFPPPAGSGDVRIDSYQQMLRVINHVLSTAPTYNTTGMVGFPINAILDYPMITTAGQAAFASGKVNRMFQKVLRAWTEFLDSPESCYVLNEGPGGWLSPEAWEALQLDLFTVDRDAPFGGFKSWNDFFIRTFKPGVRPVAGEGDDDVIVSACESAPYALQDGVNATDTFWIKSQPYSLRHMLAGRHVGAFVGGTVYQAFLSAKNYHRWHAPVSGEVVDVLTVPGTYYAEAASAGFDPAGPNDSQGYIAHVATRGILFLRADNPKIGLVAIVTIGMAEVSSCVFVDDEGEPIVRGRRVGKGDQIGYFQFGGSTHCLVLGPKLQLDFSKAAIPRGPNGESSVVVPVNSYLARVR